MEQPTLADIDEALTWLRMSFHAHDGDDVKQAFIRGCIDSLLDQRQAICVTV